MNETVSLKPLSENAIYISFGETIDDTIYSQIRHFTQQLDAQPFPGMIEYVPAYTNITIYYDPIAVLQLNQYSKKNLFLHSPFEIASNYIEQLLQHSYTKKVDEVENIVSIPVVYGGEYGPDLAYVAKHRHLTEEEVIQIHSERTYRVYMLGFAPGFPFLGGLDERLATPRKATPQLYIEAGSVGIAGAQTGIYPLSTPGGWQIIGRTPRKLFLPEQTPPTLLRAGDLIQFQPISEEQWEEEVKR